MYYTPNGHCTRYMYFPCPWTPHNMPLRCTVSSVPTCTTYTNMTVLVRLFVQRHSVVTPRSRRTHLSVRNSKNQHKPRLWRNDSSRSDIGHIQHARSMQSHFRPLRDKQPTTFLQQPHGDVIWKPYYCRLFTCVPCTLGMDWLGMN